ncbi:MAG: M23 family metallopeptidase [bacterium]|nr:M23 family metallopeptidase [bacterium]
MRQFRLRRSWFILAVAAVFGCLSLALVFGIMTWSLSSKIEDTTALKAKVTELESTNERIRDIAERLAELKQFEQQLRRGLQLPEGSLPTTEALEADPGAQSDIGLPADTTVLNVFSTSDSEYPAEVVLPSDVPTHPPVRGYVTRQFEHHASFEQPAHYGLDVAAREGTTVDASAQGLVIFAGWSYPYGNLVILQHKSGYQTFYGHNQVLLVEPGERVLQGQPIALLGNSGRSSAPHLHFEIWKDGVRVDPESVLAHDAG